MCLDCPEASIFSSLNVRQVASDIFFARKFYICDLKIRGHLPNISQDDKINIGIDWGLYSGQRWFDSGDSLEKLSGKNRWIDTEMFSMNNQMETRLYYYSEPGLNIL